MFFSDWVCLLLLSNRDILCPSRIVKGMVLMTHSSCAFERTEKEYASSSPVLCLFSRTYKFLCRSLYFSPSLGYDGLT
ncbi:hypothetical protein CSUI_009255 [Cystoisospora suis]|uniref:Uncharacterized protein n=1 Tax=Cystoisospora suis TaxID=483139 RepID=A0A2C6JIJ0_9APIC|nr:hypothetical protein CSUI_009255 [Cystoisospora suis]